MSANNISIKQYIQEFNNTFLFNENTHENIGGAGLGSWINYVILVNSVSDQLNDVERKEIESFLGSTIEESEKYLLSLLVENPRIFSFTVAFWTKNNHNFLLEMQKYCQKILINVRDSMPSQKEADEWVTEATLDIITTFPVEFKDISNIDGILVNAIATKFSWREPYNELLSSFAKGMEYWGEESYLFSSGHIGTTKVFSYKGHIFGEHIQASERNELKETIFVTSIVSEKDVPLELVYEAGTAPTSEKTYLVTFEDFEKHKVDFISYKETNSTMSITKAVLPAWEVDSTLLLDSFGLTQVYSMYRRIFKEEIDFSALQVFKSAYNKNGFEAAALTTLRMGGTAFRPVSKKVEASVNFIRPFVAITEYHIFHQEDNAWIEIPLFTSIVRKSSKVTDKNFK